MPEFPLLTHLLGAAALAIERLLQHCEMGFQNCCLDPEIGYCLLHCAVSRDGRDAAGLPRCADWVNPEELRRVDAVALPPLEGTRRLRLE
jgi:hypothetical protein